MPYQQLKIYGYNNHQDKEILNAEYDRRYNSLGTIKTKLVPYLMKRQEIAPDNYPLFVVPLQEIALGSERISNNSKVILELANSLPDIANEQFFYETLSNEIISTNEIEGVHSSRREVALAIEASNAEDSKKKKNKNVRLESTVKMYLATFDKTKNIKIKELYDVRNLYDNLLAGEIEEKDELDGVLFRAEGVNIIDNHGNFVHKLPDGEDIVNRQLTHWIEFINDQTVPFLIKALVGHYFFENTHPFYDGNGRTGRYILSTYLSRKLDHFTGTSFSQIVSAQKSKYYEAFKITGDVGNRGEVTFFVITLLELIESAQRTIIDSLKTKTFQLHHAEKKITDIYTSESVEFYILYLLAQSRLFNSAYENGLKNSDIIRRAKHEHKFNTSLIKRAFDDLAEKGYINLVAKRPLQYLIDDRFIVPPIA